MPFYLVIILAPKIAFLNGNNEVVVRRNIIVPTSSTVTTHLKSQSAAGLASIVAEDDAGSAVNVKLDNGTPKAGSVVKPATISDKIEEDKPKQTTVNYASLSTIRKRSGSITARPKLAFEAPARDESSEGTAADVPPPAPAAASASGSTAGDSDNTTSAKTIPVAAPVAAEPPKSSLLSLFDKSSADHHEAAYEMVPTESKVAEKAPPQLKKSESVSSLHSLRGGLESLEGVMVGDDEAELTEVNIRGFVMGEMDKMFAEYVICARPTLVDDETGNSIQAMCICEKESVDEVMARLAFYGVGNLVGSINVLALESSKFYRAAKPVVPINSELSADAGFMGGSIEAVAAAAAAAAEADVAQKKKNLIGEVASQIRVEQVVESIHESAEMDFDYMTLLIIASVIAGIGLATNNSVAIVASMLVSPIMGPVMACTFGTIVNKWSLVRLGAVSELLSLLICCIVGFAIGLATMLAGTGGQWPTNEMRSRGLLEGLAIGLAIAIPSGMGVALSILGNNTSSLVGVAISASLLPPAVNCGMCLAYAAAGFKVDPAARDDDGNFTDSNSYSKLGGISLALVIVNIGAIYLAGCLMFRIKEVAPIQNKRAFWEKDTHVFRKLMRQQYHEDVYNNNTDDDNAQHADDLDAQINMLKEVGKNRELRQQLMQESDDVLLSLSRSHGSPVSTLLSTSNEMQTRKAKLASPVSEGRNSGRKPKNVNLLDLFRDDKMESRESRVHGPPFLSPQASPSKMWTQSLSRETRDTSNRPVSTNNYGGSRLYSLATNDELSAVKDRLRSQGKPVSRYSNPKN